MKAVLFVIAFTSWAAAASARRDSGRPSDIAENPNLLTPQFEETIA
jgi:hypothetical protein